MPGYRERIDPSGQTYWEVAKRGQDLLEDPFLNKGTCFTAEERRELGLDGLLPPGVATEEEQRSRSYENFRRGADDVQRYLFLAGLQDRNETLFYRLLLDHVEEMLPIVYTPTVGKICELYSHLYRRPYGLYVSTRDRGHVHELVRSAGLSDVRIIVATDNEAILGLGDLGAGGMPIAIGKSILYCLGAGFHPRHVLPVSLDVGTDNRKLLDDPLYLGVRHPRLRGEAYVSLLDEFVAVVRAEFPRALVQWEDFASRNAFDVMNRYRKQVPSFDDDVQGTGAVIVAGIRSGLMRAGRRLADERVVFHGTGASGAGCALALRAAMAADGVPSEELARRVLCLDSRGLILADRPGLDGEKRELAADPALARGWTADASGRIQLEEVVRRFHPGALVGASGQPGAFSEPVVRAMLAGCARPIVLPISNPTSKAEATPADLLAWTDGAAIVGTGSPFPPVAWKGRVHEIGQGNNVFIFPGVGLGAVAVEARWLPDSVFSAASDALAAAAPSNGPIYPALTRLREVSLSVALAVARVLVREGAAPSMPDDAIVHRVHGLVWEPRYVRYRSAEHEVPAA